MWTILKVLAGIQANYWGDISPPSPPCFGTPARSKFSLNCFLKELKGLFFKFSLISFHSLAPLNSILFCPADLKTRGKK